MTANKEPWIHLAAKIEIQTLSKTKQKQKNKSKKQKQKKQKQKAKAKEAKARKTKAKKNCCMPRYLSSWPAPSNQHPTKLIPSFRLLPTCIV
jgi:hypothetical protein